MAESPRRLSVGSVHDVRPAPNHCSTLGLSHIPLITYNSNRVFASDYSRARSRLREGPEAAGRKPIWPGVGSGSGDRIQPGGAEFAHTFDHGEQGKALVGEAILHARRHLGEAGTADDAGILQPAQTVRQCLGADAVEGAGSSPKRRQPVARSRTISGVQRSPMSSAVRAIGQPMASARPMNVLLANGRRGRVEIDVTAEYLRWLR